MNTKEVSAIAIKFFAFWLLIYTVAQIPSLLIGINNLHSYSQQDISPTNYSLLIVVSLFIGLLASFLLFRVSNSILNSIPVNSEEEKINVSQGFLLQLGGVYFIVTAISSLVNISRIYVQEHVETSSYIVLATIIFRLLVGISMLMSSKRWVYMLNKIRGRI